MDRTEFLAQKYLEARQKWLPKKAEYYANPAISYVEPFKIADNLYYVGDKQVCIHLIDTGDGLILLDSGFPCATYLLIESIWRAGFDPKTSSGSSTPTVISTTLVRRRPSAPCTAPSLPSAG